MINEQVIEGNTGEMEEGSPPPTEEQPSTEEPAQIPEPSIDNKPPIDNQ